MHLYTRLAMAAPIFLAFSANAQDKPVNDTAQQSHTLKEVSVTATKSAIETAMGKTILNVQALSATAGKNVLDVLRNIPGVTVDGAGNISVVGKDGVLVMIDGRQTYLSGDELRDYLRSTTAEEVSQIEVITQPSAQYDAEGNAGIINIKMRKSRRQGINGSATANYTKSKFGNTYNTLLLNYRKNKTNWYLNADYLNGYNGVWWKEGNYFKDANENIMSSYTMQSSPVEWYDKYNLRTGADCNYNEQITMGFSVSGAFYANSMHSVIDMQNYEPGSTITSERNTYEHSLRRNATANAYLNHTYAKGSEIKVNLDYLLYTKNLYQYLNTAAYNEIGVAIPDQLTLRDRAPRNVQVYSAKIDNTNALSAGLKLESGAKYSYVSIDNAAYFMQYAQGDWTNDNSRSNRFLYNEQIGALYVNAIKKLSNRWDAQLGLRGEYAVINGLQEATGERLSRRLPAIFPTAYISYHADSANTFELNYGKRIERPQYNQLNPFNYYTFYNTYQRGNPLLLPQYTHNVELRHNYKNHWITSVQFSLETDPIGYMNVPDTTTNTTYGMPVNFSTNKQAYASITYTNKPLPWWELMLCASARYNTYNWLYNSSLLEREGGGLGIWMSNRFVAGKWEGDCFVQYSSLMTVSSTGQQGASIYSNLGLSRKLDHDAIIIKVSVDDPFYIYRTTYYNNQPGLISNNTMNSNSRYCTLSLTYNFGRNTAKATEKTRPDEAGRVGG